MKRMTLAIAMALLAYSAQAQLTCPHSAGEDTEKIMSEAYWRIWNQKEQARIDKDIEKHRKSNAIVNLPGVPKGTQVEVKQIESDFVFGAHIFNFNQLGSTVRNQRYRALYGDLFNSATVAFYWRPFEMEPGRPRFVGEYWDSEAFWNNQQDPKNQPHWRRPASDPVVDYCISRGIRVHGHTLIWGSREWQMPTWIFTECMTEEERGKMEKYISNLDDLKNVRDGRTYLAKKCEIYSEAFKSISAEELAEEFPELTKTLKQLFSKRITEIAKYYGSRIDSWDVVNESAADYGAGAMVPGSGICKSRYGIMPGDYTYEAFKVAQSVFPDNVKLNINDYNVSDAYPKQVLDLQSRGCKIDIMGSQMHLFNPQQCLDIAAGKEIQTPSQVRSTMQRIGAPGLPIHLSEITITAPGNDRRGQGIQAIIAYNLYRLWFSIEPMMGITWWNVVDDCGAPGEPSVSGLFSRNMEPKPAYYVLEDLINNEWKTNLTAEVDDYGAVRFRGFKGTYLLSWEDADGNGHTIEHHLQ